LQTTKINPAILLTLDDGGQTGIFPTTPHGYRSCVILSMKTLVCCGTSGVDISYDGVSNWQLISTQSFHVVQKPKKGKLFLSRQQGKDCKT